MINNINKGNNNGENTEKEIREQKIEEIQRIAVSKQAQEALTGIIDRINDGFLGGKLNRTQAANWVLLRYFDQLTEVEIKQIRVAHFDEVAMLESLLRTAKETGKVPTEFRALLQKQLESDETPKKKSKKLLTENHVNDVINEDKE